jgi:hypothetical protein
MHELNGCSTNLFSLSLFQSLNFGHGSPGVCPRRRQRPLNHQQDGGQRDVPRPHHRRELHNAVVSCTMQQIRTDHNKGESGTRLTGQNHRSFCLNAADAPTGNREIVCAGSPMSTMNLFKSSFLPQLFVHCPVIATKRIDEMIPCNLHHKQLFALTTVIWQCGACRRSHDVVDWQSYPIRG